MNCITQLHYTLFSEPALLVGHLGLEQDVSPVSHPLLKSLQFLAGPVMRVAAAAVAAVRLRRNCGATAAPGSRKFLIQSDVGTCA